MIPGSLPVKNLESYFRGRIRAANSIVNEARVVAGLRKAEMVRAQAGLLGEAELAASPNGLTLAPGVGSGGRGRHIVVSEERVCGVCHKRLGRSVVSVLPDNSVVHYACSKKAVAKNLGSVRSLSDEMRMDSSASGVGGAVVRKAEGVW